VQHDEKIQVRVIWSRTSKKSEFEQNIRYLVVLKSWQTKISCFFDFFSGSREDETKSKNVHSRQHHRQLCTHIRFFFNSTVPEMNFYNKIGATSVAYPRGRSDTPPPIFVSATSLGFSRLPYKRGSNRDGLPRVLWSAKFAFFFYLLDYKNIDVIVPVVTCTCDVPTIEVTGNVFTVCSDV